MKNTLMNRGLIVRLVLTVAALSFIIYLFNFSVNRNTNQLLENVVSAELKLEEQEKKLKENEKKIKIVESTTVSKIIKQTKNIKNVTMKDILSCNDRDYKSSFNQIGDYWALQNYVRADFVHCSDTITYTTHSDFTFLDNVIPLLERWEAPLSVALYAPGSDFDLTLSSIMFLRICHPQGFLVQQYATFHIFFDNKYFPLKIPPKFEDIESAYICPETEPFSSTLPTFKTKHNLTYPVNVARNLARSSALTHFVLASDIELYPNPGMVDKFFKMIMDNQKLISTNNNVFVLPIFEVEDSQSVPSNKTELQRMFHENQAIWFHTKICKSCHSIPQPIGWISSPEVSSMIVHSTVKRIGDYDHWEPIFIGSQFDPLYDIRLNWEGKSDKMTQALIMCILDYNFHVLSNAFLVHKPGIKNIAEAKRPIYESANKNLILKSILPEIEIFYGTRKGCKMYS